MHNVIIFGEAGCGKSSLVNMIVDKPVAKTSNGSGGCTSKSQAYEATIDNATFRIHDTAGLNQSNQGRVPHSMAEQGLYKLIEQLDGVSLLIFCNRGMVKKNATANWKLLNKRICGKKVPILAVVTGLEEEDDPDDWWKREENRKVFRKYRLNPLAVGCIVSFLGKRNEHADVYAKSQAKVRRLIKVNHRQQPWNPAARPRSCFWKRLFNK